MKRATYLELLVVPVIARDGLDHHASDGRVIREAYAEVDRKILQERPGEGKPGLLQGSHELLAEDLRRFLRLRDICRERHHSRESIMFSLEVVRALEELSVPYGSRYRSRGGTSLRKRATLEDVRYRVASTHLRIEKETI